MLTKAETGEVPGRLLRRVVEGAVVKTMRQGVPGFSDLSDQDIRLIIRDKITRVTLGNEEIRIQPKSNPVEALPEIRIPRTALSSGNTQTEEPAMLKASPASNYSRRSSAPMRGSNN